MIMKCKIIIFILVIYLTLRSCDTKIRDNFTEFEIRKISQFRGIVHPLLVYDYQSSDDYLYPWLKVKNFDLHDSRNMLARALEWRKLNRIDTIYKEIVMAELTKPNKFPASFDLYDNSGSPGLIIWLGKWDMRKAIIRGKEMELSRYFDFLWEVLQRNIRLLQRSISGKNITQGIIISDLSNYNGRQHGCLACLTIFYNALEHYVSYYPTMASNIIGINAPRIFQVALSYVLPLLDEATRDSLKVFSYDRNEWEKEIFKHFNKSELPVAFGGTKVLRRH